MTPSTLALIPRAAKALDITHTIGERGPRTLLARQRLATFLDTKRGNHMQLYADIAWLEKATNDEERTQRLYDLHNS